MITKFRSERSLNGFSLDVLKSGLQKYIRRGNTEKAVFCAGELFFFSEAGKEGERIITNFKHRLMVILLEDVCNLSLVSNCFLDIKAMTQESVCGAIVKMCISDKARICSHARAVFTAPKSLIQGSSYLKKVYEDIVQTNTDLAGWCEKFSIEFSNRKVSCVYYAFKIHYSEELLKKAYKRRKKSSWFIFSILKIPIFEDLFLELQNLKEGFLCWLVPLLHALNYIPHGEVNETKEQFSFEANKSSLIELDEFVFDKHTLQGKGSGRERFVQEGAFVFPEASFVVPEWKAVYEAKNDVCGELYETKEYEFIIRAQLVTRRSGQDVYFAKDVHSQRIVVVKGPFEKEGIPQRVREFALIKKARGLPYLNFEVKKLIPDRWPEGTPLGLRNNVSRERASWFLVTDSLLTSFKEKEKSSKLWPSTTVVDFEEYFHLDFESLTDGEMTDYVLNLLTRYEYGVGDLADRNFLHYNGRILSIDEEARKEEGISFQGELKKKRCAELVDWIEANYENRLVKRTAFSKSKCICLFQ